MTCVRFVQTIKGHFWPWECYILSDSDFMAQNDIHANYRDFSYTLHGKKLQENKETDLQIFKLVSPLATFANY